MTRWGVVGCGWVAREFFVPALRAAGHELSAACDPDAGRARALGPSGPAGPDLGELLRACEAVYVATPNHAHHDTVLACAAASRDVLCEKPMALSLAAAREMVEACRIAGVRYATAHNQRHHPAHRRLRNLVRAGTLGQVTQARVLYACTAPAWWNDADWHFDPERAGGGAVADLAPHGIDLIGWLCDTLPERAVALPQRAVLHEHPVEDGGVLAVAYDGELIASVQVAYHHAETLPRRVLELIGTDGMARATDTMGQDAGGRLELFQARDGQRRAVSFDETLDPFAAQIDAFLAGQAADDERDLAVIAVLEPVLDALRDAGALV
ncbi:MAG: Gfo/Idh/MocA family oxidoreductase [Solirubrobacterales bacterium]|nr:Gfo/Idh/MocA family oxidoreductase [Solirubrobacterales bacterium]MBV9916391.1 Gfo/Idh/MocA family oxidoreductase [Solirubrobacterales bacterium]